MLNREPRLLADEEAMIDTFGVSDGRWAETQGRRGDEENVMLLEGYMERSMISTCISLVVISSNFKDIKDEVN